MRICRMLSAVVLLLMLALPALAEHEFQVTDNHPSGNGPDNILPTGETMTIPTLAPAEAGCPSPHLHGVAFGHADPAPSNCGHGIGVPVLHGGGGATPTAPSAGEGFIADGVRNNEQIMGGGNGGRGGGGGGGNGGGGGFAQQAQQAQQVQQGVAMINSQALNFTAITGGRDGIAAALPPGSAFYTPMSDISRKSFILPPGMPETPETRAATLEFRDIALKFLDQMRHKMAYDPGILTLASTADSDYMELGANQDKRFVVDGVAGGPATENTGKRVNYFFQGVVFSLNDYSRLSMGSVVHVHNVHGSMGKAENSRLPDDTQISMANLGHEMTEAAKDWAENHTEEEARTEYKKNMGDDLSDDVKGRWIGIYAYFSQPRIRVEISPDQTITSAPEPGIATKIYLWAGQKAAALVYSQVKPGGR